MSKQRKNRVTGKKVLSPLEEKVIEEAIKDPGASQSEIGARAKKALGTKSKAKPSSRVDADAARKILNRPSVRQRMQDLMEKMPKLKDEALLEKLQEGLDANSVSYFAHLGQVRNKRVDIDYRTRYSYLDLATKLKGAQTQQVELSGSKGAPLDIKLDLEGLDEIKLKILLEDLEKTLAKPDEIIEDGPVDPGNVSPS